MTPHQCCNRICFVAARVANWFSIFPSWCVYCENLIQLFTPLSQIHTQLYTHVLFTACGVVLLSHLTCRFVETRRSLHRTVQKLLTARLPTAFKPPAAAAAYPRFPTSPTGSTTMRIMIISYPS